MPTRAQPAGDRPQRHPALHAMLDEVRAAVLAGSAEAEALGTLPLATVEALERAGFLRLKLPAVLGGLEADPLSYMELMEALSHIDASAAWTAMTGATGSGVIGAFLPDEAVAEIFAGGQIPRAAAVAMPSGIAERVDGGYRLSGRWRFASGIRHAAWVGACAFVGSEDGVGRTVRLFVVRREAVLVHDNWHVLGLRGTGSCDFSMTDLFVPANFSFAYHVDPPRRGGALYRIRGPGQTANEHAAVALGTARRALEEIVAMADSKTRGMQTQVRLNPATAVLQSGDAGWTLSGVDPVTGNTAAFAGGALHLYGGFDGTTYQGGIGLAKAYDEPLSSFASLGFSYVINQSANADTPVVHVTLVGATADSHFASGFTNLVYVPAFNGVTGRDATVDGFAQGNEWYSTDEPGGLSAPGGQNNPRPISFFQTNEPTATIIQISLDNGNSSTGTIPYGSEDFSADGLIVGFGNSFTRYDLGG